MKNIFILIIFLFWSSSHAQNNNNGENLKDSIFFRLDKEFIQKGRFNIDHYYLDDALKDKGSAELFLFKVIETKEELNPGNVIDLKQFIRNSEFYHSDRKINRLDDYKLASYLNSFIVFLVDLDCESPKYLRVYPLTEIE